MVNKQLQIRRLLMLAKLQMREFSLSQKNFRKLLMTTLCHSKILCKNRLTKTH